MSVVHMSETLRANITLTNPSEVLAAVPHLLGFHPTDSLMVITVQDSRHVPRLGMALRTDLPDPAHRYHLADYLLNGPIRNNSPDAVILIVVGERTQASSSPSENPPDSAISPPDDGPPPDPRVPPHLGLIEVLTKVFRGAGVDVLHTSWTAEIRAGQEWVCYDGSRGEILDPKASSVGAAMAAEGCVTFDSKAELQELVASEPAENLARRAAKLDVLTEETAQECGSSSGVQSDLETVFAAIRRTATGAALTEDDLLRVLLALSDSRVRDLALSSALDESAQAAEQLWLALVRKAPPPELADVSALLAVSAYLRGDGALAGVALERIEETRPEHRLGRLLRRALDFGIPSADLALIVKDAAEDARTLMEEDGAW